MKKLGGCHPEVVGGQKEFLGAVFDGGQSQRVLNAVVIVICAICSLSPYY